MKIPFIDLKTQYELLKLQIQARINRVLEHGQYIMGPEVEELESMLVKYTGAKHCVTVASGTDALLISLMALGIEPGDEVITTPFSFIATTEVIALLGAKPIFVDIDPDSCNIDVTKIEDKINTKTKAIIPVSLFGQPADIDEINIIAARYGNIPVIEDAAQSFGAELKGKKSCNLSTVGCTSFFPSKPLGCYGDGGAIFTSDDKIAEACREIRIHGQSNRYIHTRLGVGGRMDTLQCAVLLAKLERFNWEVQQRIQIGNFYTELISNFMSSKFKEKKNSLENKFDIRPIIIRPNRSSVYAQYTIICKNRDNIQLRLKKAEIPTAIHYPIPINEQIAYKHLCCEGCTPNASLLAKQVISLPMFPTLQQIDQEHIVNILTRDT